ncbi:MAG: ATP-binding protein, partial [Phascolarctobacterium sp.]
MLCALLNDKAVNRSVWALMTFLSSFCLLAAVNPCPCGYLLDKSHKF